MRCQFRAVAVFVVLCLTPTSYARYYDPEYGRFLSRDEIEGALNSAPSLHRYAYAHDNPLRYTDPTGHQTLVKCASPEGMLMCGGKDVQDLQQVLKFVPKPPLSSLEPVAEVAKAAPSLWTKALVAIGIGSAALPLVAGPGPQLQADMTPDPRVVQTYVEGCRTGGGFSCRRLDELGVPRPAIELPTTPEKEGVVIEDSQGGQRIQLGPNPWGQGGNPDHKNTIVEEIEKAKGDPKNKDKEVRPGKKGDVPGTDFIPDITIKDPETDKTEGTIEIGRTNGDGTAVARERRKQEKLKEIGIDGTFVPTRKAPDEVWEKLRREREQARKDEGKGKPDPGPRPPNLDY